MRRLTARFATCLLAAALATGALTVPAPAETLADFGYGSMRIDGVPASGQRKLVVILAQFAGMPNFVHGPSYFDSLLFHPAPPSGQRSVNGFLLENSAGRFQWSKAGIIGPLNFTANETAANFQFGFSDTGYIRNIVRRAVNTGAVNFASYDHDADGVVRTSELSILILTNGDNALGNRSAGTFGVAGASFTISNQRVAMVREVDDFVTLTHEITHSLGAFDLYGSASLSQYLTLMHNGGAVHWDDSWHLDPWHEMALGWCEPRLVPMREGGRFVLPAAQSSITDRPLLLYDPAHGNREYFLVEYRTPSSPWGGGYDTQVSDRGMILWHVQLDSANEPLIVPGQITGTDRAVWAEGPPNFQRGSMFAWQSVGTTPKLVWANGSQAPCAIEIRPWSAGDGSMTVEVVRLEDTWADFQYLGAPFFPENGSNSAPWNTLTEAYLATGWGGTLRIKSSATNTPATLSKRMTITAEGGPVRIGP